ncbi:MAG TPA: metallophosphatase [Paludibacteraceae bacterium]|nr:metallophosphatase [Paludibacteraceae bacterium]
MKTKYLSILLLGLFFSFSVTFSAEKVKLVILHTNDTHSQIEPTEKSPLPTSNRGGYARRMGVINQIREQEKNVLLLDAGDFWQGTPYFNFYHGRIEVDGMNRMNYDAVTIGNHEFDNGLDTMAIVLKQAKFPIISSNYQFNNPLLDSIVKPYLILNKNGIRIGIMALNIDPKGLILKINYKKLKFNDPLETAINVSDFLKNKKKCDVIICLSHLGCDTIKQKMNDYVIAQNTKYIDVIISGHSHVLLTDAPVKNANEKPVTIAQMGKSGFYLGKIILYLEKKK